MIEAIPLKSFELNGRIIQAGSEALTLSRRQFQDLKARGLVERVPGARWQEVVCVASGPSLTAQQLDLIRRWRDSGEGRAVIVCNTSYQAAPWADVLYFIDSPWWHKFHREEVQSVFQGEVISPVAAPGVTHLPSSVMDPRGNTGAGAIRLARHFGARRIILVGYDCHKRGGSHWHGDHPKGLGNAGSIAQWPAIFAAVAKSIDAEVINCSPGTALTCFPTLELDLALGMRTRRRRRPVQEDES